MKRLVLTAFFFSAGPAAALDAENARLPAGQPAAPAAESKPPEVKYSAEIRQAAKNLALLLERGGEVPPARLDELAPELARFSGKLENALGRGLLEDAARREKEREEAELDAAAKSALQNFRGALQVYYAQNNGKYPESVAALAPQWLPVIPELRLPGHAPSAGVTVIGSRKYDKDFTRAVTDSGGWLYFSAPDSANYGLLVIDCRHQIPGGTEFFKY